MQIKDIFGMLQYNKSSKNNNCRFNTNIDLIKFIQQRSIIIHKSRHQEINEILKIANFINNTLHNIPTYYTSRCGHQIVHDPDQQYSEHDTSRQISSLLIHEFDELLVNLYSGSNISALRIARSMIECLLLVVAAISDQSIFYKSSSNKNKPICFTGLQQALQVQKVVKSAKKNGFPTKKLQNDMRDISKSVPTLAYYFNVKIPDGIGKIPSALNKKIINNFTIVDSDTKMNECGSQALYSIYKSLSEYVHIDLTKLYDQKYDNSIQSNNLDEFDEIFPILLTAIDTVIYFYIILLDINNYNDDVILRTYITKHFPKIKYKDNILYACSKLLNSKNWKNKNMKFTDPY